MGRGSTFGKAPEWTSPGQDLYEALLLAIVDAGDDGAGALDAVGDPDSSWRRLTPIVRAVFDNAAARFLSEG